MICLHMNEPDPSGQILLRSSEILWNLLERGSNEQVTAQLSSMECVVYVSPVGLRMFSYVGDEDSNLFVEFISVNYLLLTWGSDRIL